MINLGNTEARREIVLLYCFLNEGCADRMEIKWRISKDGSLSYITTAIQTFSSGVPLNLCLGLRWTALRNLAKQALLRLGVEGGEQVLYVEIDEGAS